MLHELVFNRSLVIAGLFLVTGCLAVTCFRWASPKAKYAPIPLCFAGTETPSDPSNGWQCCKYYIYDEDYAWGCEDCSDGASACDLVEAIVSVTEWGGFCTGTNSCGVNTNDVLYFKELWPGTYGLQGECFEG